MSARLPPATSADRMVPSLALTPEFDAIRYWARLDPTRVAVIDRGRGGRRAWHYGELDALADRWATWLTVAGVGAGDRVAILARNRIDHVGLLYACLRSGSALVPLNWRLAVPELSRVNAHCRPAVILGEAHFAALIPSGSAHRTTWVDLDLAAARLETASPLDAPLRQPQDQPESGRTLPGEEPWMIVYTSGSAGEAKGVILPRRQQFWNAVATCAGWDLSSRDIALVATPFFHTAAWNVFAAPLWHSGGAIVLLDGFDPAGFLGVLRDESCTLAFGVPAQYQALVGKPAWGEPLPDLRHLVSGGAPCPPALARAAWAAGYPFRNAYGLTECGPNCFATTNGVARADPESVGWPLPFLEARVVDEQGADRQTGEVGELWLRGPQLFGGYFEAPAATAAAFAPDGWLRTGDLASRDVDGNHTIRGRRTELYITGGANVFPGEVEAALREHPAIAEAAVLGVPDERWGEAGLAFVVFSPGADVAPSALRDFVRARLAGYKIPRQFVVVDAVPRLGSGKPDRRALARLVASVADPHGDAVRETGARGRAY